MKIGNYIFFTEWTKVVMISLIAMALTILPYWYGQKVTPLYSEFIGTRLNNSADFPSYLAWMQQAKEGNILFKELYSSEAQPKIFFNPLFLSSGLLQKATNLPSNVIYHIFRFIIGFFLLLVGYKLISHFIADKRQRLIIFLFFCFGSGLGWIWGYPSVDIIQSEATNFLTLYESLINSTALLLILSIFVIFLGVPKFTYKRVIAMALLTNLLTLVHGYDLVIIMFVLGGFSLWRSRRNNYMYLKVFLYLVILSCPAALWQLYVLQHNNVLGIWATIQTRVPAQRLSSYVATYGLLLLFTGVGLLNGYYKKIRDGDFLIMWLILSAILLFNPFSHRFQQKLSIGIFIPLIILCAYGIISLIEQLNIRKNWKKLFSIAIICLFSFTNIYVVFLDLGYFHTYQSNLYMTDNTFAVIKWININVKDDQKILGGFKMSNLIPGFAGRVVYYGHYDQTVNFYQKYELAKNELASQPRFRDPLPQFLKSNGIDYIVVDEEVRSWGNFDVSQRPYLKLGYENADVEIYQVQF